MNLKDTYNKIAEDWYADHKQDDWWVEGTNHFCSLMKKGDQVLDVGCGAGIKSGYLSKKGLDVTGIDFSEKLVDIARRENSGIEFVVMDMKDATDLSQKFDGVFAQASLLHIPKYEIIHILNILKSVLRPEGYLYVAVKGKLKNGSDEAILKESDYGYPYERFFSYFTMDELEHYFNDLTLEIIYQNHKIFGKTDWLQIIGRKKR